MPLQTADASGSLVQSDSEVGTSSLVHPVGGQNNRRIRGFSGAPLRGEVTCQRSVAGRGTAPRSTGSNWWVVAGSNTLRLAGLIAAMKRGYTLLALALAALMVASVVYVIPKGSPSSYSSGTVTSESLSTTSSTGTPATGPFSIDIASLVLQYRGGISWSIQFHYTGVLPISTVMVVLWTPTPTVLCTGQNGGLSSANCVPGPGNPPLEAGPDPGGAFQAGAVFSGSDSGKGPSTAMIGAYYNLTIKAVYLNGATTSTNATVYASAQPP